MEGRSETTISEVTRRSIADVLTVAKYSWSGKLHECDFLSRLFDIDGMESFDYRHQNARGDITQHRDWNQDWPDDWVFSDPRFDLLHVPDETYLRFLCEMAHPVVQPDPERVFWLLETINRYLAADGWEIAPCG